MLTSGGGANVTCLLCNVYLVLASESIHVTLFDIIHKNIAGEWMKDGMILLEDTPTEVIDKLESIDLMEGDVLIAAYPKKGKT